MASRRTTPLRGGAARWDPKAFAGWLTTWSQALAGQVPGVVAIDGKTARRSGDATTAALHTVSAWATEQHLTLGQVSTDVKSNEITAIPALLTLLQLRDCIVTIDAIGCQTAIATAIRAKKAHYVLAVKGNQRWLHDRLVALFAHGPEDTVFWARAPHETLTHREKDHGRIETRTYRLVPAAAVLADRAPWTDLQSVGCVDATRHHVSGPKAGTTEQHRRYFITSLPARVGPLRPRGPQSLADRECLSLDPRRRFQRRPESRPPRRRARELCHAPPLGAESPAPGQHPENRAQGPAPHRGMGPRVPPPSPPDRRPRDRHYFIMRLPCAGVGGHFDLLRFGGEGLGGVPGGPCPSPVGSPGGAEGGVFFGPPSPPAAGRGGPPPREPPPPPPRSPAR